MNHHDEDYGFPDDDCFSLSSHDTEFVFEDNRDDFLNELSSDETTLSQSGTSAWGYCDEGLYDSYSLDNISVSDPEAAERLSKAAGVDSFGNEATPESSKRRLEAKASELFHGRVTVMSDGFCGTVSIYCHECCDYYRLKNKTLVKALIFMQ